MSVSNKINCPLFVDSIRDVLHKNVSLVDFAANVSKEYGRNLMYLTMRVLRGPQAIKIESGFVVLMSVLAILALVPLIATCAWCCGRRNTQDEVDQIRNAPVNIRDETLEEQLRCRKSAALVTLWIIFLLLT